MGKIVATEYLSLDGVMEDPGGAEKFEHGGWTRPFGGDDLWKFKLDELLASDALLLGRTTHEGFAAAWPSVKDEQGFADRMNSLPKFVVSSGPFDRRMISPNSESCMYCPQACEESLQSRALPSGIEWRQRTQ
jgi:dihydrofolate reductase